MLNILLLSVWYVIQKVAKFPKSAVNVPNMIIMWFVKHTTKHIIQTAGETMESLNMLVVKTQIHSRKSGPFIFEMQHGLKKIMPYPTQCDWWI